MTVTTTYPGVYLSEEASQNFSVTTSATAVPAFVYMIYEDNGHPSEEIIAYDSMIEFLAGREVDPAPENDASCYNAAMLWFMNRGGRCYLVGFNNLGRIKEYDDITLLVAAGADNSGYYIYDQFNTLIQQGVPFFGLFDGPYAQITATDKPADIMTAINTETSSAAAFYPYVKASWTSGVISPSAVAAVAIAKNRCHPWPLESPG